MRKISNEFYQRANHNTFWQSSVPTDDRKEFQCHKKVFSNKTTPLCWNPIDTKTPISFLKTIQPFLQPDADQTLLYKVFYD